MGMGRVMFEAGLAIAAPMIYFVIGSYYRVLYGFLLGFLGFALYLGGLALGLPLLSRFALIALPFAVIMHRTRPTNESFPENVNVCPVCGWRNDPKRTTCGAPRCDAELPDISRYRTISYYLPPKLVAGAVAAVAVLSILYDTTAAGRFIVIWLYAGWPAFAALALILYLMFRLR